MIGVDQGGMNEIVEVEVHVNYYTCTSKLN